MKAVGWIAIAVGAVVWAVAGWLLIDTVVPGNLDLPAVDVNGFFGTGVVSDAQRFERFLRWSWLLSQVVLLAALWLFARRGAAFMRESAAGRIGTGMLLGMLGLGIAWLATLPFTLADHWWFRRHGLTETGYVEALLNGWAELVAIFLSVCLSLVIVMALAGVLGDRWWIPGSLVFVALAAAFLYVSPYLTPTDPLEDPALVSAARQYERQQGLGRIPIRVEEVSQDTDTANAYAFGLFNSRRVVLWDTLLRDFDQREVKVVLAHELGHHSSRHLPKGLALYALLAVPGAWIVARITRRRGGMRAPEAVPLGLFVVAVLGLLATPLEGWVSRRYEAEADWKALTSTRDPAAAASLMRGFAVSSLSDPSPPWWSRVLLDTHPSLAERVAMARAWAASHPGTEKPEPAAAADADLAVTLQTAGARIYRARVSGGGEGTPVRADDASEYAAELSPDGRRLVFVSTRDGNAEIYVANADGSGARRLTRFAGTDFDPAWSPDGGLIAFARGAGETESIVVMSAAGGAVRRISRNGDCDDPDWSPDGRRLVYWCWVGDNADVYISPAAGGAQTRVTTNEAYDSNPSWSPDGKRIAFDSDLNGDDGIYAVRPDGFDLLTVVDAKDDDETAPAWSPDGRSIAFTLNDDDVAVVPYVDRLDPAHLGDPRPEPVVVGDSGSSDWSPSWSPDGRYLLYASNRDKDLDVALGKIDGSAAPRRIGGEQGWATSPRWSPDGHWLSYDEDGGIVVARSDGTRPETLTDEFDEEYSAAWAPDSRRLVLVRTGDEGDGDLWTVDRDGGDGRRLSRGAADDYDPAWSPDGAWVAFARSEDGGPAEVWVVRADGTGARRVTRAPADDDNGPVWSPDSTTLAFASDRSGDWDIWLVRPDGKGLRQLTESRTTDEYPVWSPDGTEIAFDRVGADDVSRIVVVDVRTGEERVVQGTAPGSLYPDWRR